MIEPVQQARRLARWPELLALVAGLVVFAWGVGTPSPWIDEAATMAVTRRSTVDIVALVAHVDLVHATFYLLAHAVITVAGPLAGGPDGELTAVRLLSVAAMAATAAGLVSLGRRLGSVDLGLTAAATLIALPLATRWGQDARPFALATLVAVIATALLLDAAREPGRRLPWAWYALSLIVLGTIDVLALLLVTSHAAYLLLTHPWATTRRWAAAGPTGGHGRAGPVAAVLVPALAALALPDQVLYRSAGGSHGEDVRGAAAYLAGRRHPGDAVLFVPYTLRDVRQAYPADFSGLADVAMATDPIASVTLSGIEQGPAQIPGALTGHRSVWLVTGDFGDFTTAEAVDRSKLAALSAGYHVVERADLGVLAVIHYEAPTPLQGVRAGLVAAGRAGERTSGTA